MVPMMCPTHLLGIYIQGTVLVCTNPYLFYQIFVTANLVRNVRFGTYSSKPTVISVHVSDLPRPQHRYSKGMKPLDDRQAILHCYEAFKGIMGIPTSAINTNVSSYKSS